MKDTEKENKKKFLIEIAKKHRTLAKMSRIGVAVKMLLALSLGYFDILTDFLVAKSYYDSGKFDTAYATAGFAILAIVIQALRTFKQYGKKSWKLRYGRTLAALLGLGQLVEGAAVWTGREDSDLLVSDHGDHLEYRV
ncbi:hypothetical protein TrLO_g8289 [Triparma laevis f. longispina]|uniref:Uncharacterized protein n=1 Tax=Triparma laevis f. longispina TaxID=1714387 RepID=A0A9W7A5D3_9STRA|nr:hypothetical protein TrLO_g8289 [Triparma laevis f. longispina]